MIVFAAGAPATLAGVSRLREALARKLDDLRLADDVRYDITLATAEIGNNVVLHGGPGASHIELNLRLKGTQLLLEIVDDGNPCDAFDDETLSTESAMVGAMINETGRGLALIRAAFDKHTYTPGPPNIFSGMRRIYARRPRVLIIEDDPAQAQMYAAFLKGWEVSTASSLAEARAICNTVAYDVIVADLHVGMDDAASLFEHWNSADEAGLPALVALSADEDAATRRRTLRHGIEFFVSKPVRGVELRDVAALALQRHAARSARLANEFTRHVEALWTEPLPRFCEVASVVACGGTASAGGGDLIVHDFSDGRLRIALVDIMGHGLGAKAWAIAFSASLRVLLHREKTIEVGELLKALNDLVCRDAAYSTTLATVMIVEFGPDGAVRWASAGHPAPIRASNGRATAAGAAGPLLGVLGDAVYTTQRLTLGQDERLILVTDGAGDADLAAGGSLPEWLVSAAQEADLFRNDGAAIRSSAMERLGSQPADDWTVIVVEANAPAAV